jgi:hypothetical protein
MNKVNNKVIVVFVIVSLFCLDFFFRIMPGNERKQLKMQNTSPIVIYETTTQELERLLIFDVFGKSVSKIESKAVIEKNPRWHEGLDAVAVNWLEYKMVLWAITWRNNNPIIAIKFINKEQKVDSKSISIKENIFGLTLTEVKNNTATLQQGEFKLELQMFEKINSTTNLESKI